MKNLKPRIASDTTSVQMDVSAIDIPTMAGMSIGEYEAYLDGELVFVDHHDVLRSAVAQYPLAVTPAQLEALIAYLMRLRPRFAAGDNASVDGRG